MPVIQLQSPWDAAAGFATDYVKTKNDRDDKRKELELAAEKEKYARGIDQRNFSYKQGEDAKADTIAANADQRAGLTTESELKTAELNRQIASAAEAFEKIERPYKLKHDAAQAQIDQLTIAGQSTANAQKKLDLVDAQYRNQVDAVNAKLAPQVAQAGLAEAKARVGQINASTAHENASTAHENAETAGVQQALATGAYDGSRSGRGSGGKVDVDSALSSLSANGQKFYDMLYSTNNPPTPQQAVLAIRNPRISLSADDRKTLEQMVTQRGAGLITPRQQMTDARTEARATATDARRTAGAATSENNRQMGTVAKSKAFKNLPVPDQMLLQSGVDAHGYSASVGILQGIASGKTPSTTVTPEQATRILKAIGG